MGTKTLKEVHDEVPPDYYDSSIKTNVIQRFYHGRRFKEICDLSLPAEGKILDVGCDGGTLLREVAASVGAARVVGVDLSAEAVAYCLGKSPEFDVVVGDGEDLPFADSSFDAIFCSEVLEHVERPEKLLSEIRRCLRDDGYGVLAVPQETPLFKFIWFFWTRFGKGKVWRHAHVQEFTAEVLVRLAKNAGFRVEEDKSFLLGMIRAVRVTPV